MTTKQSKNTKMSLISTVVSAFLAVAFHVFSSKPECPSYYTQAQVDAEGCTVGAVILPGWLVALVVFGTLWVAIFVSLQIVSKLKQSK